MTKPSEMMMVAYDNCATLARIDGFPCDHPNFPTALAESLCGNAWAFWFRAVDVAPVLIGHMPRGLCVASFDSADERRAAEVAMDRAIDALRAWSGAYRSAHVDDLGHLYRQGIVSQAEPLVETAKFLLGMARA